MGMVAKDSAASVCAGSIDSGMIYETHKKIKEIALQYKEINRRVSSITDDVKQNWVGKGRNEFQSQYNILIKKIDDFGDTLQDIYDALVDAEASYEDTDDAIRQNLVMSMKN